MLLTALLGFSMSLGPVDLTRGDKQDPYYQMESHNLNTMNSYFVPQSPLELPKNAQGEVDLADYAHIATDYKNPEKILTNGNSESNASSVIHLMSSYFGVWLQLVVFLLIAYFVKYRPQGGFAQTIMLAYDGLYTTFEDLLGKDKPTWMKQFVVHLFWILVVSNGLGWISDIIRFFFPWWLRNVTVGTAELEFNVAMALVGSFVILYVQRQALGGTLKLMHEYVPITGKGLMDSKVGDIVISLFMGLLDIIGFFARIISLSLRLFGNMSAGSILLNVAFLGLGAATVGTFMTNMPIGIPLIVYLQGVLTVLIQAFVFSLIIGIGIKMAAES